MIVEHRITQRPDQIVDIADWLPDDDFPIAPQGRKPKSIVRCPALPPQPFLIGNHRYIFKQPIGPKVQQIWSEIIAYELARDLNMSVPPAFAAINSRDDSAGVLIEFFYGYQYEIPTRFFHAIEVFQGFGINPEEKIGSLRDNIDLCRKMQITDRISWWAHTVAFDALIGNTDRHAENWGFLIQQPESLDRPVYSMAPTFDNGTSLGSIIRDKDLPKYSEALRFEKFLRNGVHHFGWTYTDNLRQHVALCGHFSDVKIGARESMRDVIQLTDQRIAQVANWCSYFGFPVRFSRERAQFVIAQIIARRNGLAELVGA